MRWWRRKPRCKAWIIWRTKLYKRDDYRCVLCGRTKCRVDPHHILPKRDFPKLKYYISNGATLCRRCHRKTFKKELWYVVLIVTKLFGSLEKWKLYKYYKGKNNVYRRC